MEVQQEGPVIENISEDVLQNKIQTKIQNEAPQIIDQNQPQTENEFVQNIVTMDDFLINLVRNY